MYRVDAVMGYYGHAVPAALPEAAWLRATFDSSCCNTTFVLKSSSALKSHMAIHKLFGLMLTLH
jgi:hypothetical protein